MDSVTHDHSEMTLVSDTQNFGVTSFANSMAQNQASTSQITNSSPSMSAQAKINIQPHYMVAQSRGFQIIPSGSIGFVPYSAQNKK